MTITDTKLAGGQATSLVQNQNQNQTQNQAKAAAGGALKDMLAARQAKLKEAAQKFEGMMLQELLKPMQKAGSMSGGGFGGEDDDPERDASMDVFSSYGVEAMAEALSKGGGLGLAKQVLHQIGKADEKQEKKLSSTKV